MEHLRRWNWIRFLQPSRQRFRNSRWPCATWCWTISPCRKNIYDTYNAVAIG